MDNIISLNEFLNDDFNVDEDLNFDFLLKEEYYDEIFSSEFFNFEELNESKKQDELEAVAEYRRIRKQLKNGYQTKKLTEKLFQIHKKQVTNALIFDKDIIKNKTSLLTEKLNMLNETSRDFNLNEVRKNKIKLVNNYKNKQIKEINKQIKEMEIFFSSNPKILLA